MNNKDLRREMDAWVKHFNHELTMMNKYLSTIAQGTKEMKTIAINQENDYSDIQYLMEVVHRQEEELINLKKQISFIHLTNKLNLRVDKLTKTMEETKWQKELK